VAELQAINETTDKVARAWLTANPTPAASDAGEDP